MSDPEQPATCQPSDPTESGWWYLQGPYGEKPYFWSGIDQTWLLGSVLETAKCFTGLSYRILGPVPTFAEVEILRSQLDRWQDYAMKNAVELTAANDEIARLKNPDLVTVLREDLRELLWGLINLSWRSKPTTSFRAEETEVNSRLTAMEDAAK